MPDLKKGILPEATSLAADDLLPVSTTPALKGITHGNLKTVMSLNNVSNDAQLKRADNDWSGFMEEGSPGSTDLLLIEKVTTGLKRKAQLGNLTSNATVYDPTTLSDGQYRGKTIQGILAGENLAQFDLVYLKSDGKWWKARANAATTMPSLGLVTAAATTGNPAVVLIDGIIKNNSWSFTPGVPVYVDDDTAGLATATYPPDSGDQVGFAGLALAATVLLLALNLITLEIG